MTNLNKETKNEMDSGCCCHCRHRKNGLLKDVKIRPPLTYII